MEIEGAIRHFSHKDKLLLWEGYYHYPCSVCKQTISGKHYRCTGICDFGIHDSCLEIPRYLEHHPFHPQHRLFISDDFLFAGEDFCSSCGGNCGHSLIYRCSPCSFVLDVKCALLTLAEEEEEQYCQKQIHEKPNHPHPLILCERKDNRFSYACGSCDLPFDDDDDDDDGGWVYVCLECKALLHKSCADLPWNIEHPFHPSHPLSLLPHGHQGFSCGACSHQRNGFTYRCSECEFDMDVHCATLKPNNSNNGGQDRKIQQFRHSHTLICCKSKQNFPHSCHACQLPFVDSIYFCPECKILLHESCADMPHEIKHIFHPQHTLTLLYHRYGQCGVCFSYSTGFFFECSHCEWYMDGRCALLKPTTMMSEIHHHPLALLNEASYPFGCITCGQPCLPPFFRCVLCNFNIDVRCISELPPIIKYTNHVHRLSFTDSPIKDPDDDDDTEYYCNACEERRELAHQSYYCKDCPYVAHPHCVVFEIIHVLEKGSSIHESHASVDENKILHVLEEECSKQESHESHASTDEVEVSKQDSLASTDELEVISVREEEWSKQESLTSADEIEIISVQEEEWSKQESYSSADEIETDGEKERKMEMELGIQHFSHKHKLFLHDGDFPYGCSACKQRISGLHYRCRHSCRFGIHDSCFEMPRFMQHPFHPQHDLFISEIVTTNDFCNSCGDLCKHGFVYECPQCSFLLDVKCASLTLTKNSKEEYHQKKIHEQPNHPHPLILCDHKDKRFSYTCNCCELPFDADILIYVCLQCKGLLHKSCAELPWNIEHPFHPSHPLVLHPRTPYPLEFFDHDFFCSGCCQKLKGFTYHCSKCFFDLDVRCASLKPTRINEGQDQQIQHFSHKHPLILCNSKQNFPYCCNACQLPLEDSIYYCPECNVLLHKSCACLPKEIKHLLHPHHTLSLHYDRRFGDRCGACLHSFNGFYFECSECEWCMDVRCALSEPATMMSKFHRHPLALLNEANYERIKCCTCSQPCLPPFFRCVLCNFNLDVRCISNLPPIIKYKNHVHQLNFTKSPIKGPDDDDDMEYYCNACEGRREVAHQSYYCKECPYVAHPHCVVYEIIHVLEKEWSSRRAMSAQMKLR